MNENWIAILKIVTGMSCTGVVAAVCLMIRHIRVAQIQKDRDRLVELCQEADGSKRLTIRGYSQEEEAKIMKQLTRNTVVDFPVRNGNGRSTMSKVLKS